MNPIALIRAWHTTVSILGFNRVGLRSGFTTVMVLFMVMLR